MNNYSGSDKHSLSPEVTCIHCGSALMYIFEGLECPRCISKVYSGVIKTRLLSGKVSRHGSQSEQNALRKTR